MQAVIEAGLIAPLVNLLQNAEFDIQKEAGWALSNAASVGTHAQIKYVKLVFNCYFLALLRAGNIERIYALTYQMLLLLQGTWRARVALSLCVIYLFALIQDLSLSV
jgi:hypothetical protein